jgi:hypothetical protein
MQVQLDLAGIILLLLIGIMVGTLWRAQKADDFDIREMLRNDEGKVSVLRICSFGAFAFSSWGFMKDALSSGGPTLWIFVVYIALWGGMPVASKVFDKLDVWGGKK